MVNNQTRALVISFLTSEKKKKFSPRKKKLKISTTNLSNNVMRDARRADLERDTTKISDRDSGRVAPTL